MIAQQSQDLSKLNRLRARLTFIHAIVFLQPDSESRRQHLAAVVDLLSIIERLKADVRDRGRQNSAHPN